MSRGHTGFIREVFCFTKMTVLFDLLKMRIYLTYKINFYMDKIKKKNHLNLKVSVGYPASPLLRPCSQQGSVSWPLCPLCFRIVQDTSPFLPVASAWQRGAVPTSWLTGKYCCFCTACSKGRLQLEDGAAVCKQTCGICLICHHLIPGPVSADRCGQVCDSFFRSCSVSLSESDWALQECACPHPHTRNPGNACVRLPDYFSDILCNWKLNFQ